MLLLAPVFASCCRVRFGGCISVQVGSGLPVRGFDRVECLYSAAVQPRDEILVVVHRVGRPLFRSGSAKLASGMQRCYCAADSACGLSGFALPCSVGSLVTRRR